MFCMRNSENIHIVWWCKCETLTYIPLNHFVIKFKKKRVVEKFLNNITDRIKYFIYKI